MRQRGNEKGAARPPEEPAVRDSLLPVPLKGRVLAHEIVRKFLAPAPGEMHG